MDELDDWDVERRDLPEQFLAGGSVDLARGIVSSRPTGDTTLQTRLKDLEYTVCMPLT